MECTTVGILIQQIRREKKITGSKPAYGICSQQVLEFDPGTTVYQLVEELKRFIDI